MAVLWNRRPPRMHPGCTDPLLNYCGKSYFRIWLTHPATIDLITTRMRERVEIKHVQIVHRRSTITKGRLPRGTNTFMSIWGTCYLTTIRFPKDMALVVP